MFEPLSQSTGDRFNKLDNAGQPIIDNAVDHAITRDNATQLEWLLAPVSGKALSHAAAVETCSKLDIAGHTDWRLPTRFELESILDLERYRSAVDPDLFPHTKSDYYWSSSPDASDPGCAWIVDFDDGHVHLYPRDNKAFVRAVRSVPASQ